MLAGENIFILKKSKNINYAKEVMKFLGGEVQENKNINTSLIICVDALKENYKIQTKSFKVLILYESNI